MEEGCILPCDGKDQEIIEKTLKKGRNYQVDPELLQAVYRIETTSRSREEEFDKIQHNREKENELIERFAGFILIKRIIESVSELEREQEVKMEKAGAKFVGNTPDGKGASTIVETGEIRIGMYEEDGKTLKPPEKLYADYVWERTHGINRHKIIKIKNQARKGEIDKILYVHQMLIFEAKAAINRYKIKKDLENKLKNGTIKDQYGIISSCIKYLEDKEVERVILKSKDDPKMLEENVAQVLWDHDVAGTNMVAWQFYSLQYDALRSEGKRENNLKRKIKETTKNHERKIPKNNQKIK